MGLGGLLGSCVGARVRGRIPETALRVVLGAVAVATRYLGVAG